MTHTVVVLSARAKHVKDQCQICCKFKPKTNKDREARLKFLLMEVVLRPRLSCPAPALSESRHSSPSLVPSNKHVSSKEVPTRRRYPPSKPEKRGERELSRIYLKSKHFSSKSVPKSALDLMVPSLVPKWHHCGIAVDTYDLNLRFQMI